MHAFGSDRCQPDAALAALGINEAPVDAVPVTELKNLTNKFNRPTAKDDSKSIERIERELLKKLQTSLTGIPPPPCVTDCRIDIEQLLMKCKQNKDRLSYHTDEVVRNDFAECLSKPTHSVQDIQKLKWPDLLKVKAHGLSYNRSSVAENIEVLGLRYADRFIRSETSSTFNAPSSPFSVKERVLRRKLRNEFLASRVSHLTHRRSVFSLENLRNGVKKFDTSATGTSRQSREIFPGSNKLDSSLDSCKILRSVDKENDEKSIKSGKLLRKDTIRVQQTELRSLINSKTVSLSSINQPVTTLTMENYKKKLYWAVTQALKAKQISVKHKNFKQVASNLARVVKRLFTEFDNHSVSSSSEKLLRLANKHALEVIEGHSVEDILINVKITRCTNARNADVDELSKEGKDLQRMLPQQRMVFSGKDQQNTIHRLKKTTSTDNKYPKAKRHLSF